ncbi:hypothetical protein DB30_01311 [Enhygromyxa salina]|uniref:Uncharacterized protein n=2 Tax=Enhygromyxa salina TaxID=215803 RepID=A0A0C1Z4A2_9BACT|nr:hypothetical protein DB30_01311 [Enhygromyxa salina]
MSYPPGDGDSSTGDGDGDPYADWCGLSEGPTEPWFELSQFGDLLTEAGRVEVECGFQGFFMIEIRPELGGFIPDAEDVSFHVTLDVEGYNVGPNGHFAESDFDIYVACCEETYEYSYECYYLSTTFQLFPPDQIADLSVIHEQPGQLTVTMQTPEGSVERELDVQMWALQQNMEWEFCEYLYPDMAPLQISALPIP